MSGLSKITFYGGTAIDYICIEDNMEHNLQQKLANNYNPTLHNNTVFLASRNTDFDGKGILHTSNGYSYSIYRIDLDSSNEMKLLKTIDSGNLTFTDYNIASNKRYQYIIFAETEVGIANAKETEVINTKWDTWSITGLKNTEKPNVYEADEDNIWLLNLSLESGEQNQNIERVEYKNLTQYPKISQGSMNYITGSISCFLGNIENGRYIETQEKLEAWRKFINDPCLKILKDRKGHKYLVQTMTSTNKIIDQSNEQINRITFNYTEVGTTVGKVVSN